MGTFYVDENGMPVQIPVQRPWHEKLGRTLAGVAAGMRDPSYAAREYSARDAMLSDAMNQRTSALMNQRFQKQQAEYDADQRFALEDFRAGRTKVEGDRARAAAAALQAQQDAAAMDRAKFQATTAMQLEGARAGHQAVQDARKWNTDMFNQTQERLFNQPWRESQIDANKARAQLYEQQIEQSQQKLRPLELSEVSAYLQTIQDPAARARVSAAIQDIVSAGKPVTFDMIETIMRQSNPKSFAPGSTINQFLSTPTSAVPSTNAPPAGLLPNGNLKL